MPEIDREALSAKLDTIPEGDREAYVQALKANGYTWKTSSASPVEVPGPSFNPLQPPQDILPSTRTMPPGGEMRPAGLLTRLKLALPKPISEAIEPGQTGMNRNIIGGVAEFATEGGPGGAASLAAIPGQTITAPKWATSMKLGEQAVPLTPAEITQTPAYSAAERMLHNIPFSADIMQKWNQVRNAAVSAYRDGLLSKTGTEIGPELLGSRTQESIQFGLESRMLSRGTELGAARSKIIPPGIPTTPEGVGGNLQAAIQSAVEKKRDLGSQM